MQFPSVRKRFHACRTNGRFCNGLHALINVNAYHMVLIFPTLLWAGSEKLLLHNVFAQLKLWELKSCCLHMLTHNCSVKISLTGLSFASGGSGYDPLTSEILVRAPNSQSHFTYLATHAKFNFLFLASFVKYILVHLYVL